MDITIAIVTYNAASFVRRCLESMLAQEPHDGATEIIVVDGCSNDGTQEIVRSFVNKVRLIENPGRTIASNRNIALQEAFYPYIAFTDSDCIVPRNWLDTLSKAFERIREEDPNIASVGGGNVMPRKRNPFQTALGYVLNTFLGSLGSVQGTIFQSQRVVSSLACLNVLYQRSPLQQIDGFDEAMRNMCEDADLNYRLRVNGRSLYYIPGVNVEHHARENLLSWCANMYAYGIGRARLMRKHNTFFSVAYQGAFLFIPVLTAGTFLGIFWPWAFMVWLYFPLMAVMGLLTALRKKALSHTFRIIGILVTTHFCYASGLLRGFFLPRIKKKKPIKK